MLAAIISKGGLNDLKKKKRLSQLSRTQEDDAQGFGELKENFTLVNQLSPSLGPMRVQCGAKGKAQA